jgi:hypothetical protein
VKTSLLLIAFLVVLVTAHAEPPADMAADFEWFGRLGLTDVKELTFVRYFYGWAEYGDRRREELWNNGFLLNDAPEKFRILTLRFESPEFPKTKQTSNEDYRHEPADLRAFVEAELRPVDPKDGSRGRHRFTSGPHFTERTYRFVLGWMCARKGLDDLAARLYEAAQTSAGPAQRGTRDKSQGEIGWSFREKLERDIGQFEMWQTIVAFGDTRITRRELLARLRALPVRFPHCDHLARAESLAKQLEQMIAEDDAHPARTIEQIAGLPVEEQAKEWLFRLRDQNGHQMSQPGWVDIFMTDEMREDSPAHQLVKLGDAAVPGLIAALDDPRLTRSVGYGRDFFFSHEVVTIGDAALKIIQRIAGHEFYRSGRVQGTMARDGQTDPVRDSVRAWWARRLSKGVRGELAETTAQGEFSSARAGAKLLAEFPDDAATPILAGAAAAKRDEDRCEFIRLVGKLKDERALEFLLREVREGPLIGPRAEAGWQLAKLGRLDGIAPLAELWRSSAPSSKSEDASGREKLIGVLAMTDSPEGIRALAEGLRERSSAARLHVIEAFDQKRTFLLMRLGDYERLDKAAPAPSATTAAAIEELLAAQLEDTGAHSGMSGSRGGKRFDNPRLCDEAAALLAARWPDRYTFDNEAPYPVRERQRITCLNVWRKARGKSLLPLPPARPRVAAGDEMKVAEVVFAGDGIKWPESMLEVLRTAKGHAIDAELCRGVERAFLDACAGKAPAGDRGFFVDAFCENATDGVTLIAAPAERRGLAERPDRTWQLEFRAAIGEQENLHATRMDLFGRMPGDAVRKKFSTQFEEMFRGIAALPAGSPFHLHMELAPDRWDVDSAF